MTGRSSLCSFCPRLTFGAGRVHALTFLVVELLPTRRVRTLRDSLVVWIIDHQALLAPEER